MKKGLYLGRVEKYLEESWHSITTLKEAMYGMAKEVKLIFSICMRF
jgi:hypothetical protein